MYLTAGQTSKAHKQSLTTIFKNVYNKILKNTSKIINQNRQILYMN